MMDVLKPDTLNGQKIFRAQTGAAVGAAAHDNRKEIILFAPSMAMGEPPVLPHQELVEQALTALITVSDKTADPVIKAQAVAFKAQLKKHQDFWGKRFAINERARLREELRKLGFAQAAEAIK